MITLEDLAPSFDSNHPAYNAYMAKLRAKAVAHFRGQTHLRLRSGNKAIVRVSRIVHTDPSGDRYVIIRGKRHVLDASVVELIQQKELAAA